MSAAVKAALAEVKAAEDATRTKEELAALKAKAAEAKKPPKVEPPKTPVNWLARALWGADV